MFHNCLGLFHNPKNQIGTKIRFKIQIHLNLKIRIKNLFKDMKIKILFKSNQIIHKVKLAPFRFSSKTLIYLTPLTVTTKNKTQLPNTRCKYTN